MNEELRSFRFLLVPLVLFIGVFVYRSCIRDDKPVAGQQVVKPATATGGITGLQIEQATPSGLGGRRRSTADYPPGLDAARIQYLVEIDRQFSTPKIAILLKKFDEKDAVQKGMLKLGFAEKLADGAIALTRDGHMNLNGIVEEETGWRFPIAKRVFDDVMFIDRVEDDRYKATFHWHWQPNAIGDLLHVETRQFGATAEFAGGQGSWVLSNWIVPPVEPEKTEKTEKSEK